MSSIIYGNESHEVSTLEYGEWQDALDKIVGNTDEDRLKSTEWITYEFLMDKGYFVAQPKCENPATVPTENLAPRPREVPKSRMVREPEWTPTKLLRERERILREREKLFEQKKKAFVERQTRKATRPKPPSNQYFHPDGTPYTTGDYSVVILVLIFLVAASVICAITK